MLRFTVMFPLLKACILSVGNYNDTDFVPVIFNIIYKKLCTLYCLIVRQYLLKFWHFLILARYENYVVPPWALYWLIHEGFLK